MDDNGSARVGTQVRVREQEATDRPDQPTEEDAETGRAGLAQLVQTSLERASQIWLSSGGWVGSGADSGPGKSGDSTRTAVAWVFLENFGCQRLL